MFEVFTRCRYDALSRVTAAIRVFCRSKASDAFPAAGLARAAVGSGG